MQIAAQAGARLPTWAEWLMAVEFNPGSRTSARMNGNSNSGDGCSSSCHLEAGWVCPVPGKTCQQASHGCLPNCPPGDYCGNGIVSGTEACDDGVNDGTYGTCNPDCTNVTARCGDGHRSCGADAPLGFELLHEISDFQDGKPAELVHDCGCICHITVFLSVSSRPEASGKLRPAATGPTRNHLLLV